jgi:hypothetical protein
LSGGGGGAEVVRAEWLRAGEGRRREIKGEPDAGQVDRRGQLRVALPRC